MSSLTLLVDGIPADELGPQYFYSGQIVTVQGILVLDAGQIQPGDTLSFSNIGMHLGNVLPYSGYNVDSYDLVHETLTVNLDRDTATATFRIVVMGMDTGTIEANYKQLVHARPYVIGVKSADVCAPIPFRQWLAMPAKGTTVVPSSGDYIHYRFEVWDPAAGTSLKNMRIKVLSLVLFPGADSDLYNAFNFFASYDSLQPMVQSSPLQGESTQVSFVELVTDEDGYAEVFVCGKYVENVQQNPISKVLSLTWNVGVSGNTSLGWTMVLTLQASASLSAPQPPAGDVDLGGPVTAEATISWYEGASNYDHVFLFCNGEYQSDATVMVDGVLPGQPLARLPFFKYELHSKDAQYRDTTSNVLQYVLLFSSTGKVLCSPSGTFFARGMPPSAHPLPAPSEAHAAPAPLQLDSGDYLPLGWPINTPGRLFQVGVPLDDLSDVANGDTMDITVYLNGYRPRQDGYDEPRARIVYGPAAYSVTPRMLKEGMFVLDFNGADFYGFGSKPSTGEMGSLEVQYSIARAGAPLWQQRYVTYFSIPLKLPLDDVTPSGAYGNDRLSSRLGDPQAGSDHVEVMV